MNGGKTTLRAHSHTNVGTVFNGICVPSPLGRREEARRVEIVHQDGVRSDYERSGLVELVIQAMHRRRWIVDASGHTTQIRTRARSNGGRRYCGIRRSPRRLMCAEEEAIWIHHASLPSSPHNHQKCRSVGEVYKLI